MIMQSRVNQFMVIYNTLEDVVCLCFMMIEQKNQTAIYPHNLKFYLCGKIMKNHVTKIIKLLLLQKLSAELKMNMNFFKLGFN